MKLEFSQKIVEKSSDNK